MQKFLIINFLNSCRLLSLIVVRRIAQKCRKRLFIAHFLGFAFNGRCTAASWALNKQWEASCKLIVLFVLVLPFNYRYLLSTKEIEKLHFSLAKSLLLCLRFMVVVKTLSVVVVAIFFFFLLFFC